MIELNPNESRVLGVLIEKSLTTPEQYPLSLNAVVNGANQKNNREPVLVMTEDQAHDALEGLRAKGLVIRVDTVGSRVPKFRHNASETLRARTGELAILTELLLRGPQTLGELRGRASRMHPLEGLESARDMLRALMERPEPLAQQIPPAPGSRAERFVQLLCLALHPPGGSTAAGAVDDAPRTAAVQTPALADRVTQLEQRLEQMQQRIQTLADALGHPLDSHS
jgi:uncharacterized protein